MLNEERVILMTKLAAYEQSEGKKMVAAGKYFRSDYIGIQVLKSVIGGTVAYFILFALYILYDFENFMNDIYKIDLFVFAKNILVYYAVFVVAFAAITFFVYSYRYTKAKKSMRTYYLNLKKLSSMYDKHNNY